jgi:cytochrome c oxidase cbb3-type subunit III
MRSFIDHKKISRYFLLLVMLMIASPLWAAGPPAESPLNNSLTVGLFVLMFLLLIVIGILGNVLIGAADIHVKRKKKSQAEKAALVLVMLLSFSPSLFGQDKNGETTAAGSTNIGGMSSSTFYVLASIIFLELLVIIVMLLQIRMLIRKEKISLAPVPEPGAERKRLVEKAPNWWDRFNKFKPISQEADLDLGHDYDGIRELNNRLPPWWIYGFYLTIVFAAVYLWRYHISHTAPLSAQEYTNAVKAADSRIKEYLKNKGENIDETTVTLLHDPADLAAGKAIFTRDGLCPTCHGKDGSGMVNGAPGVGPNLTDDYWLHGGSIRDIFKTIKYGVASKGMPQWGNLFSAKEVAQIASYVKSLHGSNPAVHKSPDPGAVLYKEETIDSTAGKKADSSGAGKSK